VLSTTLELLGFAALTAGTTIMLGLAPGLLVAGAALLLVGQAADGVKPVAALRAKLAARRAKKA
jgi:hypothetical protein